ncbi:MAG: esterase [Bacteroidetes bacterium 24-39-8]|jgi:para-nitrobenzyl esterase|nr:MAG: esterase [Bacteroidetes bacterium 24-39-8]HQR94819.1 carboxylesterase family protein [Sediminibacterium sp.]HQS55277.1 carboxylesterase family protein [Sediminibacterium sp.]
MKTLIPVLLLLCLQTTAQTISISNGKIQGSQHGAISIFKGIPFAAPPIGNLRWKAPQPAANWTGVKNCINFSASPIQNKPAPFYCWSEEFIAKPEPLSEDCLYLNIWSSEKKQQPVFVWIYGGGLNSGSANCAIYDGEEMARKGVVFVSINYRVGVLGFMAHPELTKEANTSGNYGFLDQIAALKWIQQNITAFGGDPNNVTIAGQSAGAFSVTALITSPLAKGLFHKAIAQSGGLFAKMGIQNLDQAEAQGLRFMKKANAQSIADLRKISATELQQLSQEQGIGGFGTTLDGYMLPKDLKGFFQEGLQNQTPILTGWVTGDGSFLGNQSSTVEAYEKDAQKYGKQTANFLSLFPATNSEQVKLQQQKLALLGFAGLPAHLLARYNPQNSYLYEFAHVPTDKPGFPNYGAFHTSEVPFALHTLHTWKRPWQSLDLELENTLSSYWVNFAKTGDPNGGKLPEWKPYEKGYGNIMILGDQVTLKAGYLQKELAFLEQY